ncbi:MAG TPA: HEPN domain-containing protein [Thermoanaerobaculia bacterium]|nr:HEPN domain-containing protein [Thermoanaerobaculia bacterium]
MTQAERDLGVARAMEKDATYEWACFAAQQAAEKALKAAHYSHLRSVRGHSVLQLVRAFSDAPPELLEKARVLDGYYIPTRYVNGHPEGAPFEYYGAPQSEQAIAYAESILEFARRNMAVSR